MNGFQSDWDGLAETIVEQCNAGHQSLDYSLITKIVKARGGPQKEHKLKIEIKRDSHDFQSYGRVSHWTGSQWMPIANMDIRNLESFKLSYVMKDVTKKSFAQDVDKLITIAMQILE